MEFARTVIKNKFSFHRFSRSGLSFNRKLFLNIVLLLVLNLVLSVAYYLFINREEPRGPILTKARNIELSGRFRLKTPMGVAVDNKGKVYVADSGNDRIVVIGQGISGKRIISGAVPVNKKEASIIYPVSIAVSKDRLYVGSYGTGKVLVYSRSGRFIDALPHPEDAAGLEIRALSMTVDKAGNVYVADGQSHRIIIFDSRGALKYVFGKEGYFPGELSFVNGIAVDEEKRRITVLDSNNLRLVFFNFEGKFLDYIPLNKDGEEQFLAPRGLAYDSGRKIYYITETLLDRVVAIDETGKMIATTEGIDLSYPHGIFLGPDRFLYVVNREGTGLTVLNS